ncbi:MAG TPA: VCBS repeat-containing protein [Chitinophagaceae bacterium]
MGGGVGIGDFNNDGLKDIFFTGNQVSSSLYINKGSNSFEDITQRSGTFTNIWATGVSIVDINHDGFDDIYVCTYGRNLLTRANNLLFINQQDLTFKEAAEEYGLDYSGYSTQSVFFDYDRDGDLDMYLVNYMLNGPNANTIFPRDRSGRSPANDKLYRNDGVDSLKGHPVFTDVTLNAGIKEDGFGLGVIVSDLNNDNWPDLYVANDFVSNDELWLNNKDGSFTNCIASSLGHQSYSSMGADAADMNNDGLTDVFVVDMLPEYNERKKTSYMFMNYDRYQAERNMGYEPEFMRNMLHLNNGVLKDGTPFFSEIGQLAGIAATDWSWSALMADLDNDGWKDIHITNGIGRDFINGDFLEFSTEVFANTRDVQEQRRLIKEKLASREHIRLRNYLYLNNRDYTFNDVSDSLGIDELSMSNGAAYADLDNDGDLDMVVNNINREAFVMVNNTIQKDQPIVNHFLRVRLKGKDRNTKAFGTKVTLYAGGVVQVQEQSPVRGYYSSVDQELVFGLGRYDRVDSIVVTWPNENLSFAHDVKADTIVTFAWIDAINVEKSLPGQTPTLFSEVFADGLAYRHKDNIFNDFAVHRLFPQKFSQLGPFITTGDINNDGLTDFFIGGGFNFSGKIFSQQRGSSFTAADLSNGIKMEEDMDCVLFDADGDGDQDLLVTSGDIQYEENSQYYKPRLYTNDGKGKFTLRPDAIQDDVKTIAGCVATGDYDGDGDLDVFIGGRVTRAYPVSPRSYLLQNNKGVFTDVTSTVCPALREGGMMTAAVWTDFDNDKQTDLVIAGEWMPVQFFKNDKGRLQEVSSSTGLTAMNGMWRSLIATDIDNDGDVDFVAGNQGLNCIYKVSEAEPMQLYASDIDGNGSIDPVLFYYIKDKTGTKRSYPAISRSQLAEQVPSVKKQFLRYDDYVNASFDNIFKGKARDKLMEFRCDELASCYLENLGNGKFKKHVLPMEAQFAPVNAILCDDFDNDGMKDLLLAGNEYQAEVMTGRYDASYGWFLQGAGKGTFTAMPSLKSGFLIKGDVKDMEMIRLANGEKMILAAVNNDSMRAFRIRNAVRI